MPVIKEVDSVATGRSEKTKRKWDKGEERIFQAAGKIREGKLKTFYWKMFGTTNGGIRARRNSLKMVPKAITNKNAIFRIGESDKFYGFAPGHVKELWSVGLITFFCVCIYMYLFIPF